MDLQLLIIIGVDIAIVLLVIVFSEKAVGNCYSRENFDKVLDYTKWKQKTSKIGKVIVDSYKVEAEGDEINFKNDKKNDLVFKVTKVDGIILVETNPKKNLINKANAAFCELLKRALFHPVNPQ